MALSIKLTLLGEKQNWYNTGIIIFLLLFKTLVIRREQPRCVYIINRKTRITLERKFDRERATARYNM